MRRALAGLAAAAAVLAGGTAAAPARVAQEALLAETPAPAIGAYGLFDAAGRPAAELIPFAPATPLFSDYAEKQRWLYLPPGTKVRYTAEGPLDFPVGSALVKTFAYPADLRRPKEAVRRLETRLLIRKASGWTALAYVWNEAGTEAVLKRAGARIDVAFTDAKGAARRIDYAVPNVNQCKECHARDEVLVPIGPSARNLNADFDYPDGRENQLKRLARLGLLEGAPAPARAPRTPVWDDTAEPLDQRARAYLDANCGHCHSPTGIADNSGLNLNLEETRPYALGVGKAPVAAGRGSGGLEVAIAPGRPEASILVHRMASTEPGVMMPELSRSLVHEEGLALVRAWIAAMPKS
ncbi:SO2930 family diheme c-type cytochrome [Phenylobacterium terrae]|uniref:SO2930 family diheme c-type cytochrome n=1 Tax=Phenylobacterium terrae TaxID=2665495 RepID=A0ABW4N1T7_9CAUL